MWKRLFEENERTLLGEGPTPTPMSLSHFSLGIPTPVRWVYEYRTPFLPKLASPSRESKLEYHGYGWLRWTNNRGSDQVDVSGRPWPGSVPGTGVRTDGERLDWANSGWRVRKTQVPFSKVSPYCYFSVPSGTPSRWVVGICFCSRSSFRVRTTDYRTVTDSQVSRKSTGLGYFSSVSMSERTVISL